jgi:LmbE family N-acetylglucosaminyl deacetylase
MDRRIHAAMGVAVCVLSGCLSLQCQDHLRVVTDRPSYNVDSDVSIRLLVPPGAEAAGSSNLAKVVATVRYAGEDRPVASRSLLVSDLVRSNGSSAERYVKIWRVPLRAKTGRYEIDIQETDPQSHHVLMGSPKASSFAVYRKLVRIDELKLAKTFYVSGDPVSATVTIENLTSEPLSGLRVEFSNRYWPWIAGRAEAAKASVVSLAQSLDLPAHGSRQLTAEKVETAPEVDHPTTHQYGVVVWDQKRKTLLDISFSQLVFIHPAGVGLPVPYPGQYIYPSLRSVNTTGYRHFYPSDLDCPAVQFEHDHTMFAAGSEGEIHFSFRNSTSAPWRGVSVHARLLSPQGTELAQRTLRESTHLSPADSPQSAAVTFTFPAEAGLYRAVVELRGSSGAIFASNTLELGVNSLPRSILMFCAHEDDEGDYSGLTRAAIENHIPIHFVFFTSGDAGSCDRYYGHFCSPDEAARFGTVRMEEARASLGHLGVPREAISFLGLPDGGSGMIWYDHPNSIDPFLDPLLATDHAPYEGLKRPNLPYARDAVVKAVEELIGRFQPEAICTAHPRSVGHIDHIVNNYVVVKALQNLKRQGSLSSRVMLLIDRAFDPGEQPKTPYHYESRHFYISGEAAALAQEAGWFYQSQTGNRAEGNIRAFNQLPREESFRQILDWSEHEGWNEKRPETQ